MPQSFANDGAAGAFGGDGTTNVATGAPTPPTANDPGPGASPAPGTPGFQAGGYMEQANGAMMRNQGATSSPAPAAPSSGGSSPGTPGFQAGGYMEQPNGAMMLNPSNPGFTFADGGAVPDDGDGDDDSSQNPMAMALQSVDKTLQYGYNKYGLGGGQQEAAAMPSRPGTQSETGGGTYGPGGSPPPPQQVAGMMPTIPGNQSETPGPYTPQQPQPQPQQMAAAMPTIPGNQSETPGPYTPQQPQPQQTGAIDTDEDTA